MLAKRMVNVIIELITTLKHDRLPTFDRTVTDNVYLWWPYSSFLD